MIQTALAWLLDNLYNYMIPICLLCVLRVVMCVIELGHMKRLREKKFVYRSVVSHYKEIGTFVGLFIGSVLVCILPLKLLWAVVAVVLGVIGFKIGAKKGAAADEFWREVIKEVAASEDAEKLENTPVIDRSFAGLLDDLDLYDDEPAPAEESAPAQVAEADETEEA